MSGTPLRILVVLPMYGGSLPIGFYCASALRGLGHSVRVFEAQELYPGIQGLKKLDLAPGRINALENSYLRFVAQAIWSQIQEQEPQIVLAMAQAPMDRSLLMRLRQAGIRSVMWFVEDYRIFNYWKIYAPLYDAFAVIQKQPFLEELKKAGQEHAFYLPLAAQPDFHRRLELTAAEKKEYGSAISFMGAGYPNRRVAFRPLAGKDFKIWGSDWEGESLLAGNIQREGKRISAEESVKIYNAAKININLHSSLDSAKIVSGGDFVNPRTFELAAMGAFQLVDNRSLLPELFADDELATFSSWDEFYDKLDYFLAHEEERKAFAQKGQARVLRDHTYERRMKTLVEYMEQNFGPFGADEPGADMPELDPRLAKDLQKLIGRLGLAPNAAFSDVVARLRQRNGALDEVETAILFLDEWNRQYGGGQKSG